jgi:hypothetical protein
VPVVTETRVSTNVPKKSITPLANNDMLLLAAVEMKRFTKSYNSSLVLFSGGAVLATFGEGRFSSSNKVSPLTILGAVLMIGGGIQGISARQHIGKSGAYLEAYANGVRITF